MNTQTLEPLSRIDRRERYDAARQELLLHDVYDLPSDWEEPSLLSTGQVLCTFCGETGDSVDAIRHEAWCVYVNGPICPSIPN